MPPTVVYGNEPETILRAAPRLSAKETNHVLMGTWLEVLQTQDDWLEVKPHINRGKGGWVKAIDVRDMPALKVFFVDVGQGDGAIIEAANGRILIDGGPNKDYYRFLRHRYWPIIRGGAKVHFDAVVISHPDTDHFRGLIHALNDRDFTFGTVYHNGIIRYDDDKPAGSPFDLGALEQDGAVLGETFNDMADVKSLLTGGELMYTFEQLFEAISDAHDAGHLQGVKRLTSRDTTLPGFDGAAPDTLRVEVLGPVPTAKSGRVRYVTFPDPGDHPSTTPSSSHTRNGHSVVLKLIFGRHSLLFGGDLNIPAEKHLMKAYGDDNPFRVTVAKSCHHGSSDFTVDFLKQVRPKVNVVSSGDNKSFDHPTADAIGAAARWSWGSNPLFFSTELGRAYSRGGVHYGLVNIRSNGQVLAAAQMKEQHKGKADVWDSYTVPWRGKFPDVV